MLGRFVVMLAAVLSMMGGTVFFSGAASAQETAPAASSVMVTPGCDGGFPPNGSAFFNQYNGGDFWLDACETCDVDAHILGAIGWGTWCYEIESPGKVAQLWIGNWGGKAAADGSPVVSEDLTKLASREHIAELIRAASAVQPIR